MIKVVKRDGKVAEFNLSKISEAIRKAFEATKKAYTTEVLELLALRVTADFQSKIKDEQVSVEEIQDSVEHVLEQSGYTDVAKAYILYRKQRANVRDIGKNVISPANLMNGYLGASDWRVKENSTVMHTLGGLILNNSGAVTANYWLNEIYDEEIMNAHKDCLIHIHDLSMLAGYCAGWNLKQLIQTGIVGVANRTSCGPAKHLGVLSNQMVNFLGIMQNEWAGAQAFSSFDTYLAPYVKKDNLTYKEVKQAIQNFVFGVNMPSRWGTQAPFSNITLDWVIPEDMKNMPAVVGGEEMPFTYGECQKEADMVNKAFLEVMLEGDYNGRGFQYPIKFVA